MMADERKRTKLISPIQAAEQGINRLRQTNWANPLDHLQIDIIDGKLGPWAHLWCPFNRECNGKDPVDLLIIAIPHRLTIDPQRADFVEYKGPLPDSDEYKRAVASFQRSPL